MNTRRFWVAKAALLLTLSVMAVPAILAGLGGGTPHSATGALVPLALLGSLVMTVIARVPRPAAVPLVLRRLPRDSGGAALRLFAVGVGRFSRVF